MSGLLDSARSLARLGWPVLPVAPGAKEPLTRNGVKDATTDDVLISRWWRKWPDANVGIATGMPGPTVLDIDDPGKAAELIAELAETSAPSVATPRGRHFYFAGQPRGTINVGFGELRGRGSYVVAPPSVHPSGKEYVWLVEPNGPLPGAPHALAGDRRTAGSGVRQRRERVPHGERHDYLKDHAVRLVRSGIVDVEAIERALWAEFRAVCEPKPAPLPMAIRRLAEWAARTEIARRESDRDVRAAKPATKSSKRRKLPAAPERDAALADLRAFVAGAMGLPDVVRVDEVVRFGSQLVDPLHIKLSNGTRVVFIEQGDVTAPRRWRDAITTATSGIAKPANLSGAELGDVLWALCVVARSTVEQREEDDLQQLVYDLVNLAEPLRGAFEDVEGRYLLLGWLKDRPVYDPREGGLARQPVLVIDARTGQRYLRASELMAFARYRGLGIASRAFAGRMATVDVWRRKIQAHGDEGHREQVLYELPPEVRPG